MFNFLLNPSMIPLSTPVKLNWDILSIVTSPLEVVELGTVGEMFFSESKANWREKLDDLLLMLGGYPPIAKVPLLEIALKNWNVRWVEITTGALYEKRPSIKNSMTAEDEAEIKKIITHLLWKFNSFKQQQTQTPLSSH